MVKVIETNCYYDKVGDLIDSQSRVIEVSSWDGFVKEIKDGKYVYRLGLFGGLEGGSLPRGARVSNFWNNEKRIQCTVIDAIGNETHKMASLLSEDNVSEAEEVNKISALYIEGSIQAENKTAEGIHDEFIEWVESKGWSFAGITDEDFFECEECDDDLNAKESPYLENFSDFLELVGYIGKLYQSGLSASIYLDKNKGKRFLVITLDKNNKWYIYDEEDLLSFIELAKRRYWISG